MCKVRSSRLFFLASFCLIVLGCGGGGGNSATQSTTPTYTISGSVTESGAGLAGATVTLIGTSTVTTTTDANGKFAFTGLPNGNYSLIPGKAGKRSTPTYKTATISGADLTNINFTATASSTTLWICDDHGNLGTLDIANYAVTMIGLMKDLNGVVIIITDIALDPSTGILYGISTTPVRGLYSIDKTTAIATFIGTSNITNPITSSLEFDSNGKLFTADSFLYSVNPNTGSATKIGNGSAAYDSSGDLAFFGNQLYLTSFNSGSTDNLVKLDVSTGKGTIVGPIGFPNVYGMASNDNVIFYGVSGTKLLRIDIKTGVGTVLKDFGGQGLTNGFGLAFFN